MGNSARLKCDKMENKVWQLCPKCDGSGKLLDVTNIELYTTGPCDLCNGHKVISMLTGKPPQYNSTKIGETILNP